MKGILYNNSYPRDFVDKCINKLLDKVLTQNVVVSTVPKKDLLIVLPYLGKLSLQIRTRINRVMKNKLPHCNFRIVFQSKCKLINFFTFKDKIPIFLRSGIVYKFKCGGCNATYYGKTKRHFKVRMCEHLGVSALTGKRVKGDNDSAVKESSSHGFAVVYDYTRVCLFYFEKILITEFAGQRSSIWENILQTFLGRQVK